MPVRVVESKQNARLKELRKALAAPGRGASALVGIEGENLLEEALRAGLRVKTVFVAQGAEGLHFYTLNKSRATVDIVRALDAKHAY